MFGFQGGFMAASHGIAHEVMNCLVVDSDAGGGYSDRIRLRNLSKAGFWLFKGNV